MSNLSTYYIYVGPYEMAMPNELEYLNLAIDFLRSGYECHVTTEIDAVLCENHLMVVIQSDRDETNDSAVTAAQAALEAYAANLNAGRQASGLYALPRRYNPSWGLRR
ncbi:hypothetical protein AWENTII_006855 [Aspergillus wentii]|nr:hypothetical protein MW887_004331 [Aspergillus wentii]